MIERLRPDDGDRPELREIMGSWTRAGERFWSEESLKEAIRSPDHWAYVIPGPWMWSAFLLCQVGAFTSELLYIYVRPEARGQGQGRALLGRLIEDLRALGGQEGIFLEVRVGNQAAQGLYQAWGFLPIGLRKAYYADGEDALVMKKNLATGRVDGDQGRV